MSSLRCKTAARSYVMTLQAGETVYSCSRTTSSLIETGSSRLQCRDPRVCNRHRMPHDILADIDESSDDMLHLLRTFSSLCEAGHLEAGLLAVSRFVIAGRHDVLLRYRFSCIIQAWNFYCTFCSTNLESFIRLHRWVASWSFLTA